MPALRPSPSVAVVIPAKDEQERIAATVRAVAGLPVVDVVVVVDDGSSDLTSKVARDAGAVVVAHHRNRGKAAAMQTGARAVAEWERGRVREGVRPRPLLFVDGRSKRHLSMAPL